MSKNPYQPAHDGAEPAALKKRRSPDPRAARTRTRLGMAFIQLIHEKPIEDVTVQDVLDRAFIGRSTFYLHFRDKNDLLLSQLEMFCEIQSSVLVESKEKSLRVMPVAEMFEHIAKQVRFYRILVDAGRINDFFDLAQVAFARGIRQRLIDSGRLSAISRNELAARANALAGSLLSLLRWWLDRGAKESPAAMDELFHKMVWTGLQEPGR
jgi:AcrR family transcriptional regulator